MVTDATASETQREFETCALDLERAFFNQDLADVYDDDAVAWHNFSDMTVSKDESLKQVAGFFAGFKAKGFSRPRYVDIARDFTNKGFVQRHVVEAKRGDEVFRLPASFVIEVKNGKILKQYEYLDPKPFLDLLARD